MNYKPDLSKFEMPDMEPIYRAVRAAERSRMHLQLVQAFAKIDGAAIPREDILKLLEEVLS